MDNNLPCFHIDVTEKMTENGKTVVHKLNNYTAKICKIHSQLSELPDEITAEKETKAPIGVDLPRLYYSNLAVKLSGLTEDILLSQFSVLRVCFTANKSEKKYDFQFKFVSGTPY